MKRLVALLVALVMALSIGIVSFAEETETESEAQAKVEQSVAELTTSEEDEAYKEYFESAFVIVEYTRNCAVNIDNFFYISIVSDMEITQFSFLADLNSPLELTTDQLEVLSCYNEKCSSDSDYKSYADSTLSAALNFSKSMPAYLAVFALLEKPTVPEKYKEVDVCIDNAIAEATNFYDNAVKFLKGELSYKPRYDETYYNYLDIVNDAL